MNFFNWRNQNQNEHLKNSHEYLLTYLQLEVPFCIFDHSKKVHFASLALGDLTKKSPTALHGQYFYSFFSPQWCKQNLDHLNDTINNGEIWKGEIELILNNIVNAQIITQKEIHGHYFYLFIQKKIQEKIIKNSMNLIPFFQDISHQCKIMEEQLQSIEKISFKRLKKVPKMKQF